MKIVMNTADFLKNLELVMPAVKENSLVEEMSSVVFDGPYLITYNDVIAVSYPLNTDNEDTCGVTALDLQKAVMSIRTKEVSLTKEDDIFIVSGGKTRIELPLMNEEKLMELHNSLDLETAEENMRELPTTFSHALKLCVACSSKNVDHPHGLYALKFSNNALSASDGMRVAKYEFDGNFEEIDCYIPNSDTIRIFNFPSPLCSI